MDSTPDNPPPRPASAPPAREAAYVPEIDALRGLAMTAVVAFHAGILPFGWMGVWVFYVISGFAVTTSWLSQRPAATPYLAWRDFTLRRARRIWPVYFAYLAVATVWLIATGHTVALADLPWLATFSFNMRMILTEYSDATGWTGFSHLWTLSIEQQFYLVLPLIMLLGTRRAIVAALVALMLVAPLIRLGAAALALDAGWGPGRAAFAAYAFAPGHFDAFAAGAIIALFRDAIRLRPWIAERVLLLAAAAATLHVGAFLAIGLARSGPGIEALRNIVSGIMFGEGREATAYYIPTTAAAAVILAILTGRRWALLPCRSATLQAIGRVSYGGYLFHLPVMMMLHSPALGLPLRGTGGRILLFLLAMAIVVPLAWASHRWFETRFLKPRPKASGGLPIEGLRSATPG
ncbi:acyltransferase [Roseomonas eburnea]|uniref:Acyltransferase n=1 Tax=Neoroseomonas eburnea TaxID=1346889 RepID=A0A9X9XFI5_9PROT|nr:acyltransferase [Neoroseomonas eburnea]MBR0682471.1 acyltransferase [Neoroseomonas eburnea]